MSDLIQIDGTQGEGGGQVVRSSLALAAITGKPFLLENVRGKRDRPGLKRQHVTAVDATAAICDAEVRGNQLHSRRLEFYPGEVRAGEYSFSIGTAGSTTLVLQTILPALMIASGPSRVRLTGGTHNPLAPSYDFLEQVFLPVVQAMGVEVTGQLNRYGFFPAGGGDLEVDIQPARTLRGLCILESGRLLERKAEALVANLPRHIAEREVDTIVRKSNWGHVERVVREVEASGPGNVVMIQLRFEHVMELFTAFGRRGLPAERVASACLREAQAFLRQKVPVGEHLADQILLPASLAAHLDGARSQFRTSALTRHSLTQLDVIRLFLDVDMRTQAADHGMFVTVARP